MAKYIDASLAVDIKIYDDQYEEWSTWNVTIEDLLNRWADQGCPQTIELPSADRPKRGWVLECDAEGEGDNLYRCSECRQRYGCQEYDLPNFCPNCGASMRSKDGEGE